MLYQRDEYAVPYSTNESTYCFVIVVDTTILDIDNN